MACMVAPRASKYSVSSRFTGLGLKAGDLVNKQFQSISLKNGCCLTSSDPFAPSRLEGLVSIKRSIKSRASGEIETSFSYQSMRRDKMFSNTLSGVSAWKGGNP